MRLTLARNPAPQSFKARIILAQQSKYLAVRLNVPDAG
jgi:hypothetical protein